MRPPIAAGLIYPADPKELKAAIEASFLHELGPKEKPKAHSDNKAKIKAILAPHSHYQFSAPALAWAFKELAESEQSQEQGKHTDTYILLSADHLNQGTCISTENWQNPLGEVKVNRDLATQLIAAGLKENNEAHRKESAIEAQLPFMQHLLKHQFKILPIIVGSDFRNLADILHRNTVNKNVVFIVSSDLTHFGFKYGYRPFATNITANLAEMDAQILSYIKSLDLPNFLVQCHKSKSTVCGKHAIVVFIDILKRLQVSSGQTLTYYRSSQINDDLNAIITFASLAFY